MLITESSHQYSIVLSSRSAIDNGRLFSADIRRLSTRDVIFNGGLNHFSKQISGYCLPPPPSLFSPLFPGVSPAIVRIFRLQAKSRALQRRMGIAYTRVLHFAVPPHRRENFAPFSLFRSLSLSHEHSLGIYNLFSIFFCYITYKILRITLLLPIYFSYSYFLPFFFPFEKWLRGKLALLNVQYSFSLSLSLCSLL